jgi:CheY-like chemotaxis protein
VAASNKWELDILVAEDTPSDIDLLKLALDRCGEVRSLQIVRDGQEVIDYLRGAPPFDQPHRQVPNIIFMDLKMPRMDGFGVLAWLRKNPDCAVIPVIIMSASGLPPDILQAYRLGANAYFKKPTDFGQLQEILKTILTFWAHAERPSITELVC